MTAPTFSDHEHIMTLITLKDIGVTLGSNLFSGLNFTLNKGDRVGLVAGNGRGKSTLFRCLARVSEATSGDITRARGLRIGLVEQDIPETLLTLRLYDAVLQVLSQEQAETESWRVDIALDDLKVPNEIRAQPLGELSGGWRRVALFARAWVDEPDVLLLDEPTNHLDLSRIGILQTWLSTTARTVPTIIASHDRAFLDTITNRTLFLREENSRSFALSYTPARVGLAEADGADERRYKNDMKQAQHLRRQAAKLKNISINSGSDLLVTKTKQLNDRASRLENSALPAQRDKSAGEIRLASSGTHAKALVAFDNTEICTPDGQVLFNSGKTWINRGDRIVVLGGNGAGKTQFVSHIHRAITDTAETVRAAPSLVLGYCDQEQRELDSARTPIGLITHRFDIGDQRARSHLAGAGFNIDLQSAPMKVLSGGQRMRLAMLVLRLTNPNFYLLDEPTNHLDIEGQEALEAELKKMTRAAFSFPKTGHSCAK
jgi:ATPase subunit of ABC transporter with duplicated ATPase domains